MISTAVSHPNKAIVIYWGNSDDELNLPSRTSLSMTLQGVDRPLDYTVTLKTSGMERDQVIIDGREDTGQVYSAIVQHLDAMRDFTGFRERLLVLTKATFPIGSGLAGSAAAASALAEAFAGLLEKDVDKKTISAMARRGSGSAARSVFGGFVKLPRGAAGQSFAVQVFDEQHWDLRDIIAVVDSSTKKVNSRDGMRYSVKTCPAQIYSEFVDSSDTNIADSQGAIACRDIHNLGKVYEFDNSLFRNVCLNTEPVLDYWTRSTTDVFNLVSQLQGEGLAIYAGTDAGPNVHILCNPGDSARLIDALRKLDGVDDIIHAKPGGPSMRSNAHLNLNTTP